MVVLGATGSIGLQALDVIERYPDSFELVGAVAGSRAEVLERSLAGFPAARRVVVSPAGSVGPEVATGVDAACELCSSADVDVVLIGGGGAAGLLPTLAAVEAGRRIALATKEVMVMAGELVTEAARRHGAEISPVDSEHSAIWQCLRGGQPDEVRRLVLTASGGPFRASDPDDLEQVTPEQALAHPNWRMGPKITVDSATMMNKGLEVIEAHFLFQIPYERIAVLIHPQSAVHSAVEFCDGTMMAQLGVPDMRAPIALALSGGRRLPGVVEPLDLPSVARLDFEEVDPGRFPALPLAREAALLGGTAPAVLNAANEVAVAAFLRGAISFGDIVRVVAEVTRGRPASTPSDLDGVLDADLWARRAAREAIRARAGAGAAEGVAG